MLSLATVLVVSLASSALAQSSGGSSGGSSPSSGSQYTLTPAQIAALPIGERDNWCEGQKNTCIQVCGPKGAFPNTCDPTTLDWTCHCSSGAKPDLAQYQESMPAVLCVAYRNQCVADNTQSASDQQKCLKIPCGTKIAHNPTPTKASHKTPSVTKSTAKSTHKPTHTTKSVAPAHTTTNAAVAVHPGSSTGAGAFAVGMLALFGLAL